MLAVLALSSCGSAEPPPVQDTVVGDMVGTMDRARSVETTTLQHKQALDEAIEQQAEGANADH
jgi:hypothetical protein